MKYKCLTENTLIRIDDDGITRVSCTDHNPEYLAWVAEGNTPEPADPVVVPIPNSITMRQARLQLLADGKLDEVSAAVEPMGAAAKIEWEYASDIQRTNPLVPAMQALLGWDEARTDQFFTGASKL